MKKYIIPFILFITLFFSFTIAKEINEKDLWRYDLERAILFTLSDKSLLEISSLAENLKGKNIQESMWNILKWEKENIIYDLNKASLPEPLIYIWSTGKIEIVQGEDNIFQTPYETIQRGKGTCKDYALLTAGLLLKMGYYPYILDIEFQNDPIRHLAVGMVINGWLFILDQNPPVMDSGSYYKHWLKEEGKIVENVLLYEIHKEEEVNFKKYKMRIEDFRNIDYIYTLEDLEIIGNSLMKTFEENFTFLKIDPKISSLDKLSYLLKGYTQGKIYFFEFPNLLEYYNPIFHNQFLNQLYEEILEDVAIDIKNFKYLFIRLENVNGNINAILNLAK